MLAMIPILQKSLKTSFLHRFSPTLNIFAQEEFKNNRLEGWIEAWTDQNLSTFPALARSLKKIQTHKHLVCKRTFNHLALLTFLAILAKWLSACLQTKWLWVRILL